MISLRAMMMRGGTSKGVYLLQSDLDETGVDPDVLLPAIMGSPDHRQIDGMGGQLDNEQSCDRGTLDSSGLRYRLRVRAGRC